MRIGFTVGLTCKYKMGSTVSPRRHGQGLRRAGFILAQQMMVLWRIDIFDRMIWNRWRPVRRRLHMNIDTGALTWRDVPWR